MIQLADETKKEIQHLELSPDDFFNHSGVFIEGKSEEEIFNLLYRSSFKYYYASFDYEDLMIKLEQSRPIYANENFSCLKINNLYLLVY